MKKALFLLSFLMINSALADQNYFNYSYDTEVLPKGKWQLYQWMTHRGGKIDGNYNAQDHQTEFEYGITNNLQASYYLMYGSHFIDNVTRGGKKFSNQDFQFNGMKVAFKYNVINPYLNDYGFGLALYLEPGYSLLDTTWGTKRQKYFTEAKLLLQKNFLNDKMVTVMNIITEYGRSIGANSNTDSVDLKITAGLTYLLMPNIYVGFEGRIASNSKTTAFTNFMPDGNSFSALDNWVFHAGPVVNYAGKNWWVSATFFPQIWGTPYASAPPQLNLQNSVTYELRIKFGYNS